MNIIFAGTPVFAARALEAIIAAGFNVPLVLRRSKLKPPLWQARRLC